MKQELHAFFDWYEIWNLDPSIRVTQPRNEDQHRYGTASAWETLAGKCEMACDPKEEWTWDAYATFEVMNVAISPESKSFPATTSWFSRTPVRAIAYTTCQHTDDCEQCKPVRANLMGFHPMYPGGKGLLLPEGARQGLDKVMVGNPRPTILTCNDWWHANSNAGGASYTIKYSTTGYR